VVETGSSDSLRVEIDSTGTIVVFGDIDIAGGPILEAALRAQEGHGPVAIDLRNVSFIDSSGLRSLLNASRRANERSSRVVLRDVGHEVKRLLEITGTTERFSIESTRE
jgi:anti-sigma B factor antagonist